MGAVLSASEVSMPLSEPAPREALHRRTIEYHGYRHEDGL